MGFITSTIVCLNIFANILGKCFLGPLFFLPGWLSNTLISAVAGVIFLLVFKYTSDQQARGRIWDRIYAQILALKLFGDSITVTLQAQKQLFAEAFRLLFGALRPMLVMIVPVSLLLGQMGLVYQYRPLNPGEETVVTMKLKSVPDDTMAGISIESMPAELVAGPVRIVSRQEICWKIRARDEGLKTIRFKVDGETVTKELAVGKGFMRVSRMRPALKLTDILAYPQEKPFSADSRVRSITVGFPERISKTSGTDWWLGYFFAASMVFALIVKPFLNVRI